MVTATEVLNKRRQVLNEVEELVSPDLSVFPYAYQTVIKQLISVSTARGFDAAIEFMEEN